MGRRRSIRSLCDISKDKITFVEIRHRLSLIDFSEIDVVFKLITKRPDTVLVSIEIICDKD